MRVAVTGASGFLGRTLCSLLRARGHEAAALDRATTGDLAAATDWPRHLAGAGAVVHLAALAHARGIDEERLRRVNVEAPLALGKAAAAAGVKMLLMSSVKVLGEETSRQPFDDSSPPAPQDAYGRAKAAAEAALRAVPGLALTILRPPLVYGPGVKANFLALLRAAALGKPVVALFGDSPVNRWCPWGVAHRVVRPESRDLADLPVEPVLEAFQTLA